MYSVRRISARAGEIWIGNDNKIHYDATALSAAINALGVGEQFKDTIQYTIKMSNGTFSVGTLTVVINGATTRRSLTGTQATLAAGTEDTGYTINASDLLAGFTDVDGDTLSVSGLTANHGSLVDNGNGTWTFTPAANYNGPVSLSYNVIDSHGGSVAATPELQPGGGQRRAGPDRDAGDAGGGDRGHRATRSTPPTCSPASPMSTATRCRSPG